MEKSYIKNVNKKFSVDTLVNGAHKYVRNWTKQEATKILRTELVILPTSWGLQVGKYAVKYKNNMWQVFNVFDELVDYFSCKQSAVTYCVLEQTNRIKTSMELRHQDTRLSKLVQDQTNYLRRRITALKNNDSVTVDVIDARMSESDSLLNLARKDLEKTLRNTKYLKGIWE